MQVTMEWWLQLAGDGLASWQCLDCLGQGMPVDIREDVRLVVEFDAING